MQPGASDVLFQGYLPAAQGLLFAVPANINNGRVEIDALWICNTNAAAVVGTILYGAGTLTKANSLFWNSPFEGGHTHIVFGGSPVNLKSGFKFEGNAAGATDIVVTIFGRVITG
jgi:hypothetical protein